MTAPTAPLSSGVQVVGFRIMRETEIAPEWWGQPSEVGETGSATVVYNFCAGQNAVTMNPNRTKRIHFYADPIFASSASVALQAPAADDHGKTKEPLPQRPRGPHPYRTAVTS